MCVYDYMPYVHRRRGEEKYKVDTKSILQSLITAAVTGLLVMYGTQRMMLVEIEAIRDDVGELKKSVSEFRSDFYVPRHKR